MPDPAIFFVHIPKTAGLSLYWAMANAFPMDTVARFDSEQELWQAESSRIPNLRLLAAHAHIGFRSIFPQQPFVFTFLRSPLDRTISAYWHLRNESKSRFDDPEFQAIIEECQKRSFEEIIFDDASPVLSQLGNIQTQYLGMGPLERLKQDGKASEADVPLSDLFTKPAKVDALSPGQNAEKLAKQHLECLPAFGILEYMETSLELIRDTIGLDPDNVPQINVGKKSGREIEISPRAVDRVRELTSSDQALYESAVQLIRQKLSQNKKLEIAKRYLRPKFRFDPPSESIECRVSDGIIGGGWYPRETRGNQSWCWNGYSDWSWIDCSINIKEDLWITINISNCMDWETLNALPMFCNGKPITRVYLSKRMTKGVLRAFVPADQIGYGMQSLRIEMPVLKKVIPASHPMKTADRRPLFMAIEGFSIRCT